jgi:hypothetical protein
MQRAEASPYAHRTRTHARGGSPVDAECADPLGRGRGEILRDCLNGVCVRLEAEERLEHERVERRRECQRQRYTRVDAPTPASSRQPLAASLRSHTQRAFGNAGPRAMEVTVVSDREKRGCDSTDPRHHDASEGWDRVRALDANIRLGREGESVIWIGRSRRSATRVCRTTRSGMSHVEEAAEVPQLATSGRSEELHHPNPNRSLYPPKLATAEGPTPVTSRSASACSAGARRRCVRRRTCALCRRRGPGARDAPALCGERSSATRGYEFDCEGTPSSSRSACQLQECCY